MRRSNGMTADFPVDRIERELILKLMRGEYRAGDYLPSGSRLARNWSVSRTTVGAAVGRLLARGLLTMVPGIGIRVEEILETCDLELLLKLIDDKTDAERALELEAQLLDLMYVVFIEVVYRAAACRTDDHLRWFNHYLRIVLDCVDQDAHVLMLLSAQYQLLKVLAAAGGSVAFTVILNALRSYLEGRAALQLFPPEAWSQLVDALEKKDGVRARQIFQRCFDRRTSKVLERLLKARGFTPGPDGGASPVVDLVAWVSEP